MSVVQKLVSNSRAFIFDYCARHNNPLNAGLHLLGVPMVFFSLFMFFTGNLIVGLVLFIVGYILQYFGHQIQGNEVGEITLLKKVLRYCLRRQS